MMDLMLTKRVERFVVAALLISTGIVPICFYECFPFSGAPMFAASFDEFRSYHLTDANGIVLDNDIYGLRSNPNWYLESYYAVKFPDNVIAPPIRDPDIASVISHLQKVGTTLNAEFPLTLTMTVLGDIDGARVGVRSTACHIVESIP